MSTPSHQPALSSLSPMPLTSSSSSSSLVDSTTVIVDVTAVATTPPTLHLALSELVGRWHIIFTDFPMWLAGDKTEPTFNYGLEGDGLSDSVQYLKDSQPDSIKGHNTPLNSQNTSFQWRGRGLLWLISSHWDLKYVSPDRQWAVVHFGSTLFTPEGHDVIHRQRDLDTNTKTIITSQLAQMGINPLTDLT
jgi:hypothetical protein